MLRFRFKLLLSLLITLLPLLVVPSDFSEVVFSGFVELPSTANADESIDFSKVEIQLFTDDDKFVDKTSCSQNGFFLLPISHKKSYVIKVKPPQESTFEPESIAIDLRGKNNDEILKITEQSLSFKFIGFSLTGQVGIKNSQGGPTGVKVALYDAKGQKISDTLTTEGGNFKFDNVLTGKYRVQLESKEAGFYWNEGEGVLDCELNWKNGQECRGNLLISSFEVRGSVNNVNNVLGKHIVFLYSDSPTANRVGNQPAIRDHPLASSNRNYIAYAKLDKEGNFRFEGIPAGDYFLRIYTSDKASKIEVEPETYVVNVRNTPVVVQDPFKVSRFSVQGRVVDQEGKGISGIRVALDGERGAVSDANGQYEIDKVPIGTYTLEGHHEHLFFHPNVNVNVDTTSSTLPDLVLSFVHICGEISIKDGINDQEFANAKITIHFQRQGEHRSVIPDANGQYCLEVQPGRYSIYPSVSNVVKQENLFHPKLREVDAFNQPILDVNFYRPRLFIQGTVKLLPNVKPSQIQNTKVVLSSPNKSVQKTVSLRNDNTFVFDQVLPGYYKISLENDNLCWKEDVHREDIVANVSNIVFEQTGFALKYQTSRALEVRIFPPQGNPIDTQLLPSSSSYCVESAGVYRIAPDICYRFNLTDFNVNTDDETPLHLDPTGYLIRGEIVANESLGRNTPNFTLNQFISDNLYLNIQTGPADAPKRTPIRMNYVKTEGGLVRFNYAYYVEPNSEVLIELKSKPKVSPEAEKIIQNLMFNPTQVKLSVGETCILDTQETQIEIRQGLILTGSVEPAVSDWTLTVLYKNPQEGQDALVEHTPMTSSTFRLGPYMDFYEYEIKADKDGYRFDPTIQEEGYNIRRVTFKAQKLSQLRIQIQDEQRRPVPGAFLIVSSTSKKNLLKLNNYTNEKGQFSTSHLVKGEYAIKSVLKEYSFDPPLAIISIDDGEHKDITITAKRVAYSAYGKIQKLNKGGCQGLKVQAVPQNAAVEVSADYAETDEQGNYRIMGLVPGTTYVISVEKSPQFASIKPESVTVKAEAKDITNLDFLGFERRPDHVITGNVDFDSTYSEDEVDQIDAIQVRLYAKGQQEPLNIVDFRLFRYFEFKNLQPQDYTIKVLVKRAKNQLPSEYTHEVPASLFGDVPYVPVDVKISKDNSRHTSAAAHGSFLTPVFVLIAIFLFLNFDLLTEKYKKFLGRKEQPLSGSLKRKIL